MYLIVLIFNHTQDKCIMKRLVYFALFGLTVVCCQREAGIKEELFHDSVEYYAVIEDFNDSETDTKVYADENMKVLWNADDRISIFNEYTLQDQFRFNGSDGDNAGTFTKVPGDEDEFVVGNELDYIYAVYPYSESLTISNAGVLNVELPEKQKYREKSFGQGANTMVSVTTNKALRFKNACGYLAFKLYGDNVAVSSITIKGNDGEKLAGKAKVSMELNGIPVVSMQEQGTESIDLQCEPSVILGSSNTDYSEFWFAMPPVTFTKGFTITVKTEDGGFFTKSLSSSFSIARNSLKRMAALKVVPDKSAEIQKQPTNEIWYTSSQGKVINLGITLADMVSNVYKDGKGVITLSEPVTEIPGQMFMSISSNKLTSVSLPETVTSIGNSAFQNCDALSSVSLGTALQTIGALSFSGCSSLAEIEIPETVTSIGNSAFSSSGLKKVKLPSGLNEVGTYLFSNCTSLESADFSRTSLNKLNTWMFYSCSTLKDVFFPPSLISIEGHVFENCTALGDIILPNGLTTLGYETFLNARVQSLLLPSTFTTGNTRTFSGCSGKLIVAYDSTVKSFSTTASSCPEVSVYHRFSGNKFSEVEFANTVTCIENEAFHGSAYLKKVTIPGSVKVIGQQAFQSCDLESVRIPESVEILGPYAFDANPSLESIVIENGLKNILHRTFSNCPNVKTISLPGSIEFIGALAFAGTSGEDVVISRDIETEENGGFSSSLITCIEIREGVTSIPDYFFTGCTHLTDVTLPATLKTIGKMAFWECTSLTTANIPEGVTAVGDMAFGRCYGLTEATVPSSVVEYGWRVFEDAGQDVQYNTIRFSCNLPNQDPYRDGDARPHYESLQFDNIILENVKSVGEYGLAGSNTKHISLPATLKSIGNSAFAWCAFDSVTIPEGVTTLGTSSFYGCGSLKTVYLPSSIEYFGDNCFNGAILEEIHLAEGLKSIGKSAFSGPIKTLTIPSSVTSIGQFAIPVDNLETLYMFSVTPPAIPGFKGEPDREKLKIIVPASSLSAYKLAWASYKDNIFPDQALPENYGNPGHAGEDMKETEDNTYDF